MPFGSHKSYKAPCQDKSALTVIGRPCRVNANFVALDLRIGMPKHLRVQRRAGAPPAHSMAAHATPPGLRCQAGPDRALPASGDGLAEGAPPACRRGRERLAARKGFGSPPRMWTGSSRARSRPICPWSRPPNLSASSISRLPWPSASPCLRWPCSRMQRMNTCAGPRDGSSRGRCQRGGSAVPKGLWAGQSVRSTAADAPEAPRAPGPIRLPPLLAACPLGQPPAPHSLVVALP